MDYLLYGIHHREGFIVITGQIGTGKTTICRAILEKLDEKVKTAVIFNSFLTEEELLESILLDFGFPSKGRSRKERIDALNKLLIHYLTQGKNAVLIIDEAQNLSPQVLEQIRMLSNLETEKEKMLQIVLLGQLELDEKLRSDELKQLNQRIAIRHHLRPLTQKETESYIYQRLMIAGSQGGITFSKPALKEIYHFSKGTPRLINLVCDRALLGGFVGETSQIDREITKKARKELEGEESIPSAVFSNYFPPLRIALLGILIFLLTVMILLHQGYLPPLQEKIQGLYLRISGQAQTSDPVLPADQKKTDGIYRKNPSRGSELSPGEGKK